MSKYVELTVPAADRAAAIKLLKRMEVDYDVGVGRGGTVVFEILKDDAADVRAAFAKSRIRRLESMIERVVAGESPAQALDEAKWSMTKKEAKAIAGKVAKLKGLIEPIAEKGQIIVMFQTSTALEQFRSWVSSQYGYTGKWAMSDIDTDSPKYKFGIVMDG